MGMKMICDVPNEVIKSVRMGTWCGSSVAEKMIANGIPLEQIRTEIEMEKLEDSPNVCVKAHNNAVDRILQIIDKYKAVNNS